MEEGQATSSNKGNGGRTKLLIVAAVAVVVVVVVAAVLFSSTGGSSNADKIITKTNAELVINLNDLPGWDVDIAYRLDPYAAAPDNAEVGVARYVHNISTDPLKVGIVTFELYHMNTTEQAKEMFAQYLAQGVHSWQSIDLETVGNVSVGDEAVLSSGNWTGSHGAIKTLVFRENNMIVLLVYEAAENVGLSNETVIEMAKLQDQKLLK